MAKNSKPIIDVTIAVPTYNGEEYLNELIESVLNQATELRFELLIIDSGSKDKTLEIINKYHKKLTLHQIPNKEFGHGRTRNLAASMARGELIVYLSQDAVPADEKWLQGMVEPFYLNEKVACVVGKQTPRRFADATTKREVSTVFNSLGPDHSIMIHRGKSLIDNSELEPKLTFFSDVNSAVRLSILKDKIPYRDVPYSEDQLLGADILNSGYLKCYAPSGNVMHSNEYPVSKYFSRRVDEYTGMLGVLGVTPEGRPLSLIKLFITETAKDYGFIFKDKDYSLKQKVKNYLESPIRNFEKLRASYVVCKNKDDIQSLNKFSLEAKSKPKN